MSGCLYCNNHSCRAPLETGRVCVTFCSHIFCVDCGRVVAANLKCGACGTLLDRELMIMETDLNPREEWKHLILAGLSPTAILEIATKALAFHYHQKQMEVKYLNAKLGRMNNRVGECKAFYEQTIAQLKGRIDLLENQLNTKQKMNETNNANFRQPQSQNVMPGQSEHGNNGGFNSMMGTNSMMETSSMAGGSAGFHINSESNLFGNKGSTGFRINSESNLFGNKGGAGFRVRSESNLFGNNNEELGNLRNGEEKPDFLRNCNGDDNGDEEANFFSDANEGQGVNFLKNVNEGVNFLNNGNEGVNFGGVGTAGSTSSVFGNMGLGANGASSSGLGNMRKDTHELRNRRKVNIGLGSFENCPMGIVSSEAVFRTNKAEERGNGGGNLFENGGAGRSSGNRISVSGGHLTGLGRLRKVSGDTSHLRGTLSGSSFFKSGITGSFGKSIRGRIQTTRSITNVTENLFKGKKLF